MKTSNYLLFLAIYGGFTGFMMLFAGHSSLVNYGVSPIDGYHVAIMGYLGIANLTTAAMAFFLRKEHQKIVGFILLIYGLEMIFSSLKGFFDVKILGLAANTFFWADAIIRLAVGLVTLLVYVNISKKTI